MMNIDEFFAEAKRLNIRVLGSHDDTRAALDLKDTEIAALRKDAERYRWLRDKCDDVDIAAGLNWLASAGRSLNKSEAIDAEIDKALSLLPNTTQGAPHPHGKER